MLGYQLRTVAAKQLFTGGAEISIIKTRTLQLGWPGKAAQRKLNSSWPPKDLERIVFIISFSCFVSHSLPCFYPPLCAIFDPGSSGSQILSLPCMAGCWFLKLLLPGLVSLASVGVQLVQRCSPNWPTRRALKTPNNADQLHPTLYGMPRHSYFLKVLS